MEHLTEFEGMTLESETAQGFALNHFLDLLSMYDQLLTVILADESYRSWEPIGQACDFRDQIKEELMASQTQKMWARREVQKQLHKIREDVAYLERMLTEESFKSKLPAPMRKTLESLKKKIDESLAKIEDWAITGKERADKEDKKLNSSRRQQREITSPPPNPSVGPLTAGRVSAKKSNRSNTPKAAKKTPTTKKKTVRKTKKAPTKKKA